jgi:hypothetical protein
VKQLTIGACGAVVFASLAAFAFFGPNSGASTNAAVSNTTGPRRPVLLELFTSEGCSDCPPADRVLDTFYRTQPVAGADLIVLSEHVDYWDRLGWRDPFSSPIFTQRQQEYVKQMHLDSAYTPELVVDGQSDVVGSDERQAQAAIVRAESHTKFPIHLTAQRQGADAKIEVGVSAAARGMDVFVALAEDHAQSQVLRGENSGHTLRYVAVVTNLLFAGKTDVQGTFTKEVSLPLKEGGNGGWRVVAFLQEPGSKHIVGAAQTHL